ncbi:DUF6226 family protein [Aeromicrobium sp. JJY06]|uniref:DUF6226 family protein n=1 Tax=Aeromicrobium sp. JJY06 TaxID=3373478 RepID=UPI00376EAC0A
MLPDGWIPHRRGDGEVIGWLEIVGDDVIAHDLLGRRVTAPGVDWHEAEQALEERGIGYLADAYTVTTTEGALVAVRIGEVTTDRVTVVEDAFGGASVVGADPATHVLPFPVPRTRLWDYVRPRLDLGTWLDDDGRLIAYGSRWLEPPEDSYSTCRHPERFAPVVEVARALIGHLERTYDVERTENPEGERTRITLTPTSGDGTPITVLLPLAGLPGVEITAGLRYRNWWPGCGCDACDESVPDLLDELERAVFALVEGTMREWRSGPSGDVPWMIEVEFDDDLVDSGYEAGWSSGSPEPVDVPTTPRRWGPWPLRG